MQKIKSECIQYNVIEQCGCRKREFCKYEMIRKMNRPHETQYQSYEVKTWSQVLLPEVGYPWAWLDSQQLVPVVRDAAESPSQSVAWQCHW